MPHKSKGIRCQYDQKDLERAVTLVKSKQMSLRGAAKEFSIPKSTIADRITGRVKEGATPGKQPVIPLEVEGEIAEKIKAAGKQGFGITRAQLCMKVYRLALAMKIKTPFRNGVPGKDWVDGFKKRHPDLSLRSPTPLNSVRARMLNPKVTENYFVGLGSVLQDLDLKDAPHNIWNIDETNVSLTHKPSKILAETGQKNVPGRVGNCRDGVTVLACINAAGKDIPPLVIVKGQSEKAVRAYNVKNGPVGTKYTYQKKAWMEDILGITWFQDHFLKHCGPERPQIIILDSHSSHETLGLIDLARQHNVALFALPPHTTQYLNPLDKTVFGPFQREYNKVCTDFMSESPNNIVTKWEWPSLFKSAYVKTVSPENIVNGFEVCGIYPFNPARIPDSAFAPSTPFDRPLPTMPDSAQEQQVKHATPTADNLQVTDQFTDHTESAKTTVESANEAGTHQESDEIIQEIVQIPEGELIASADQNGNLVLDDPKVLLELIASGQLEILESPQQNCELLEEPSWSSSVDSIFQLPTPAACPEKKVSKKKLTSHRLLTSDDIYNQKKEEKENKIRQELEKEQRKIARELKRKIKLEKPSKGKKKTKID